MGTPSRSIGTASDRSVIAQPLRLAPSVFRISFYVGDMNNPAASSNARPDAEPSSALTGGILDIIL